MGKVGRTPEEVSGPQGSRQTREAKGRAEASGGNLPQEPKRPAEARVGPGQADGEEQGREQPESGLLQAGQEGEFAVLFTQLI